MQCATARSSGEAEFMSLSSCSQECLYLQMFVASLNIPTSTLEIYANNISHHADSGNAPEEKYDSAVKIWSDSQVALAQAKKPEHWIVDKLRHICTAYFSLSRTCAQATCHFTAFLAATTTAIA